MRRLPSELSKRGIMRWMRCRGGIMHHPSRWFKRDMQIGISLIIVGISSWNGTGTKIIVASTLYVPRSWSFDGLSQHHTEAYCSRRIINPATVVVESSIPAHTVRKSPPSSGVKQLSRWNNKSTHLLWVPRATKYGTFRVYVCHLVPGTGTSWDREG